MEHIPKISINKILKEQYRILKKGGIISAKIDYSDHYAHTDKSISQLKFLKYTGRQWRKYNHKNHYQNRLRHYEYLDIFKKIGFKLIEEDIVYGEKNIPYNILKKFKDNDNTWSATSAHLVFKKRKCLNSHQI